MPARPQRSQWQKRPRAQTRGPSRLDGRSHNNSVHECGSCCTMYAIAKGTPAKTMNIASAEGALGECCASMVLAGTDLHSCAAGTFCRQFMHHMVVTVRRFKQPSEAGLCIQVTTTPQKDCRCRQTMLPVKLVAGVALVVAPGNENEKVAQNHANRSKPLWARRLLLHHLFRLDRTHSDPGGKGRVSLPWQTFWPLLMVRR